MKNQSIQQSLAYLNPMQLGVLYCCLLNNAKAAWKDGEGNDQQKLRYEQREGYEAFLEEVHAAIGSNCGFCDWQITMEAQCAEIAKQLD